MDNKTTKRGARNAAAIVFVLLLIGIVGSPIQNLQAISEFLNAHSWLRTGIQEIVEGLNGLGTTLLVTCVMFYGLFVILDPDRPKLLNWIGHVASNAAIKQRDNIRFNKKHRYGIESVKEIVARRISSDRKYRKRFEDITKMHFDKKREDLLKERGALALVEASMSMARIPKEESDPFRMALIRTAVDSLIDPARVSGELKTEHHGYAWTVYKYEFNRWSKSRGLPKIRDWSIAHVV